MKRSLFLALAILTIFRAAAQRDSSLSLIPQQVTPEDLMAREMALRKTRALVGTRALTDVVQLPYTVHVVTEEDILRNGYVTLADVLRNCPGIRVSQPGSALEGEKFLLRGLSGNSYVKVLINEVPVKSYAVGGMGIGAQLPIRQAERIEVLYGAAAVLYGGEACAGVVNIVLKETERPLFTRADLSFGRLGYNSLDLTFGGKIGKDKKIFRFTIYGSSTIRDQTDIFYNRNTLYNARKYVLEGQVDTFYRFNPNYVAFADSIPRDGAAPHDSRMFGVNFTWRGIHFNYQRLARQDHGGLGLNPVAITFAKPQSGLREREETFSLGFNSKRKGRRTHFNLSALHYRIDNRSTYAPVWGALGNAIYEVNKNEEINADSLLPYFLYYLYYSDIRYMAGDTWDLRSDIRVNISLSPKLFLDVGWNTAASLGFAPSGHFYQIYEFVEEFPDNINGIVPKIHLLGETGVNLQFEWLGPRLTANLGMSADRALLYNWSFHPRAAMMYRIKPWLALRANYASGYRAPSASYYTNSYRIFKNEPSVQLPDPLDDKSPFRLQQEEFRTAEVGIRLGVGDNRLDVTGFYTGADYLLTNGNLYSGIYEETGEQQYFYGWASGPKNSLYSTGMQVSLVADSLRINITKGAMKTRLFWKNSLHLAWVGGYQRDGFGHTTVDYLPNQPRYSSVWQSALIWDRFELIFSHRRYGATRGYAPFYQNVFHTRSGNPERAGYTVSDLSARLFLSKHFATYVHVFNVFNHRGSGIDATGTPDDLIYNPQPGRSIRLGLTYNMN